MQYFFSPYHQTSALYPIISQLGHAAGFQRDDDAAARLDKLDALLARTATTLKDAALIADLLSLPAGDRYPTLSLSPQQRKDKTLAALIRQLEALARERPVLMVFEDAHWSDPSSRELLDLTIDRIQTLPILMIVTFRPEFQPAVDRPVARDDAGPQSAEAARRARRWSSKCSAIGLCRTKS